MRSCARLSPAQSGSLPQRGWPDTKAPRRVFRCQSKRSRETLTVQEGSRSLPESSTRHPDALEADLENTLSRATGRKGLVNS
ncbi:hypothetical protein WJX84_010910 [Apatococcus fuscideae]|uniref:Uncharacterized protein n=1 Tax=Apatococcus fuscideae TaxID=2026836 RepID=A0AAW1SU94_9CHLO